MNVLRSLSFGFTLIGKQQQNYDLLGKSTDWFLFDGNIGC